MEKWNVHLTLALHRGLSLEKVEKECGARKERKVRNGIKNETEKFQVSKKPYKEIEWRQNRKWHKKKNTGG